MSMPLERVTVLFFTTVSCVVALPLLSLVVIAVFVDDHSTTMTMVWWPYLRDTFFLLFGTACVTFLLGCMSAWFVTLFSFPGKRFFLWSLLTPLVIPPYICAQIYGELLDYAGPLQEFLRYLFSWDSPKEYWFPNVHSTGGGIFVFGVVLYPYVYLSVRSVLLRQSRRFFQASQTLGVGSQKMFFRIFLPLMRLALFAGLLLVFMECLNDIGAVQILGIRTLTSGIFDAWLNRGSVTMATRLACINIVLILVLLVLERFTRGQKAFHNLSQSSPMETCFVLSKPKGWCVSIMCFCIWSIGFLVPCVVLIVNTIKSFAFEHVLVLLPALTKSLFLAIIGSVCVCIVGVGLALSLRFFSGRFRIWSLLLCSGYALPGGLVALGLLLSVTLIEYGVWNTFNISGPWFHTTVLGASFMLVIAYVIRFIGIGFFPVDATLSKLPPSIDMATQTLREYSPSIALRIYLPFVAGPLIAVFLVIAVEIFKELPATLLLRPPHFETLATLTYEVASLGLFEKAALPALTIVLVGILPMYFLERLVQWSARIPLKIK